MRHLTAIIAAAGVMALTAPVVATDALAAGTRHKAKAERKVETTGSISSNKPMRPRKDLGQPGSGGPSKDMSRRSSWGGG